MHSREKIKTLFLSTFFSGYCASVVPNGTRFLVWLARLNMLEVLLSTSGTKACSLSNIFQSENEMVPAVQRLPLFSLGFKCTSVKPETRQLHKM